jgi:hypothetical protein
MFVARGFTTATVLAAERLSACNRLAAHGLIFAVNSAYAIVVAHNYQVARSPQ